MLVVSAEPPWPTTTGLRAKLSGLLGAVPLAWDLISQGPVVREVHELENRWEVLEIKPAGWHRSLAAARGLLPSGLNLPETDVLRLVQRWVENGARYRVVHLDTIASVHLASSLRRLLASYGQRPVIVGSLNDSYSLLVSGPSLERNWRSAAYGRFIERYERRMLPTVDVVDVVSQRDVDWLEQVVPRATVRLIPLGINVAAFTGERLPVKWDLLCLGALVPGRPYQCMKRLFNSVLHSVEAGRPKGSVPLRIALAGPQPPRELLSQISALPATYLGFVGDLSELLRSSRILAVPSDQQSGSPTKALQAMAAGTPVVGMRALDGIPQGTDQRTFSRAATTEEFVDRILRLLGDDAHADSIGAAGRRLVQARHDWPRVVEQYLDFAGLPSA